MNPQRQTPNPELQTHFGLARPAWVFLAFWFVLLLVQASFAELTSDEGYYWFYAQQLQWGYYDHPPLVAVLIKAGIELLPGELGVRFFNAVLSTASLFFFLSLVPMALQTRRRTFLVLLAAPLLHYLAFIVFPDGPLLFCSTLFLVLYKRFLVDEKWSTALLLGLTLAGMAYAKYHGALVLFFTVLANPRLLRSTKFYFALLIAAVLFAPHLWWQYKNGFPTFAYHFSGRTGTWSLRHLGEYLSQQVFAIGPAFIFLSFVVKATDVFERTLKYIIVGTLAFFLVSSAKTFVHFHWTSIALFPLLYFAVQYYNRPDKKKLFNALVLPFVVLLVAGRLLLMLPLIPNLHAGEDYYKGRKEWAAAVKKLADDRLVFLPDNLREASLYSFYSGGRGITLYTRPGKKSQYELWGYEDSLQGKEVLFLTKYPHAGSTKQRLLDRDFYSSVLPSFQSYYNGLALAATLSKVTADSVFATVTLTNTSPRPVVFEKKVGNEFIGLVYLFEQNSAVRKADAVVELTATDNLKPGDTVVKNVAVPRSGLINGDYDLYFGIRSGVLPDAILGSPLHVPLR